MLPEIESERKTKRKHKNVAKRARLLVSQSLRRVRFFPSLSLSLSCWFYSRSFSLSAPPPDGRRVSGGGAVAERAARRQDGSGGPPVACARQTGPTLVSHICYEDGGARSLGPCGRRPDNVLHPAPAFLPRTYLTTYLLYVLRYHYNYSFPVLKKFIFAKMSHVCYFSCWHLSREKPVATVIEIVKRHFLASGWAVLTVKRLSPLSDQSQPEDAGLHQWQCAVQCYHLIKCRPLTTGPL